MKRIIEFLKGFRRPAEDAPISDQELLSLFVDESKVVRAKRRFIQEQRFLKYGMNDRSTDRLPPGQTLTDAFPVLDLGIKPTIPKQEWTLVVDGLVENPLQLSWSDFCAMPQTEVTFDIHCVTAWSRYDNRWSGVAITEIIERCRPLPSAAAVMLESYDGYTTNLTLPDFLHPRAMIATSWEGEPLSVEHGAPARFVVPHLYFWKSGKWLKQITFLEKEERGFWEQGGYHVRGDPWLQQRYRGDEPID